MKRVLTIILSISLFVSGLTIMPVKAADSLSANDWKNTAIVAPGNGKLIGAGHIDIKWNNNLENVSKYSVYVDSKLIKTVNANTAEKMSADFYTVQVSAHTAYIIAEQKSGTKVQTPTIKFYVTKKGLCVNDVNMGEAVDPAALNAGWYYNWGTKSFKETGFENTKFYDLDYVPMFWKDPDEGYTDSFSRFSQQGYKYVLGFNEPDLRLEASIRSDVARRTWMNDYVKKKGNILLGTPAVSIFPHWSDWWTNFWDPIPAFGKSAASFMAVHSYYKYYNGKNTALDYLHQIDECYNKYRKPIWITEFAIWRFDKSDKAGVAKTQEFLKIVLKGLNERSYVERFSWFSTDLNSKDASSSSLFDYGTGNLTTLGKMYAQIGNPAGYPAKTYGVNSSTNVNTSIGACVSCVPSYLQWCKGKKKAFKYCIQAEKGAVGYQIQYSLNKKFKKKKKYKTKIKNLGATKSDVKKGTIKKLKKKKKYYVRARAIIKLMGKKYYYGWSNVVKVKTKKK